MYEFPVVAIGSSAGGLEPLKEIIDHLPLNANAAFVVVGHMFASNKSNLDLIISKLTDIPIIWAEHELPLKSGFIYLLPFDKMMTVKEGSFQLRNRRHDEIVNKALDIFFTSLAEDAKNKAIVVVLSGCGDDGLNGAKQVHKYNGIVIVQDPKTASFPWMPEAIINGDHPTDILSPRAIVSEIIKQIGAN